MARIDPRRAKVHRSYYVAEAARLFEVHRNSVRHWVSAGLPAIRTRRGLLILGRDLGTFLTNRQSRRRRKCGLGELYCFKCQEPRRPLDGSTRLAASNDQTPNVAALCEVCGTKMFQRASRAKLITLGFEVSRERGRSDT